MFSRRAGIGLLAAALLTTVVADAAFAGGSSSPVVTKTGVVTHGAIKTTYNTVGWLVRCDYSHSGTVDPIMMPGMLNMSHRHDFFGNKSAAASSTLTSMEAAGTTCGTAADTAGYWAPSLFVKGKVVAPDATSQQLYYRYKYAPGVKVVPFPQDLRLVVGNAYAKTVSENPALASAQQGDKGIYWQCDGGTDEHYAMPPSCPSGTILQNVQFPSCWDGKISHGKGSLNDNQHMNYAPDGGVCPTKFPNALPRISLKIKYDVGPNGGAVTLSNGSAAGVHADFWNTWQPSGLQYLVDRCINAQISCGTNPVAPMG